MASVIVGNGLVVFALVVPGNAAIAVGVGAIGIEPYGWL